MGECGHGLGRGLSGLGRGLSGGFHRGSLGGFLRGSFGGLSGGFLGRFLIGSFGGLFGGLNGGLDGGLQRGFHSGLNGGLDDGLVGEERLQELRVHAAAAALDTCGLHVGLQRAAGGAVKGAADLAGHEAQLHQLLLQLLHANAGVAALQGDEGGALGCAALVQGLQGLDAGDAVHLQTSLLLEQLHGLLGAAAEVAVHGLGQVAQFAQAGLELFNADAAVALGQADVGHILRRIGGEQALLHRRAGHAVLAVADGVLEVAHSTAGSAAEDAVHGAAVVAKLVQAGLKRTHCVAAIADAQRGVAGAGLRRGIGGCGRFSAQGDVADAGLHRVQGGEVGRLLSGGVDDDVGEVCGIGVVHGIRLRQRHQQAAQAQVILLCVVQAQTHVEGAGLVEGVALDDDVSDGHLVQLRAVAGRGGVIVDGNHGLRDLRQLLHAAEGGPGVLLHQLGRDVQRNALDGDQRVQRSPVLADQCDLRPDEFGVARVVGDLALDAHVAGQAVQHGDHLVELILRGHGFQNREFVVGHRLGERERGDRQHCGHQDAQDFLHDVHSSPSGFNRCVF